MNSTTIEDLDWNQLVAGPPPAVVELPCTLADLQQQAAARGIDPSQLVLTSSARHQGRDVVLVRGADDAGRGVARRAPREFTEAAGHDDCALCGASLAHHLDGITCPTR